MVFWASMLVPCMGLMSVHMLRALQLYASDVMDTHKEHQVYLTFLKESICSELSLTMFCGSRSVRLSQCRISVGERREPYPFFLLPQQWLIRSVYFPPSSWKILRPEVHSLIGFPLHEGVRPLFRLRTFVYPFGSLASLPLHSLDDWASP